MTADNNALADDPHGTLRVGVVRASDASPDPTVAEIEARVIRAELERRVGPVSLDLRTDGPAAGPWAPRSHAAWPGDVDATIDVGDLGDLAGRLVTLFARTVDPLAADVRSRMLHHLGVLPVDTVLTDDLLADLLPAPARPTDLWLVVRSVDDLATGEPAHSLLRSGDTADITELDRWFDETVAGFGVEAAPTIGRLRTEIEELRERLHAAHDEALRTERAATEAIEHLTSERDSLRERLGRAQLDTTGGSPS